MKQNIAILSIGLLSVAMLDARFHLIQKADDLDRMLQKYDYSIVYFVHSDATNFAKKSKTDADLKYAYDQIKNRMIAASKSDVFDGFLQKKIGFLLVDLAKPGNKRLLKEFALIFTEFPCALLFDQDVLVQVVTKTAPSATAIVEMLQKQFGNQINQLVQDHWANNKTSFQVQVPNYYQYEASASAWYPYAVWPYSRWGIRPYGDAQGVGYGLELAEYT